MKINNIVYAPLVSNNKLFGLIQIANNRGQAFAENSVQLIKIVAHEVAKHLETLKQFWLEKLEAKKQFD